MASSDQHDQAKEPRPFNVRKLIRWIITGVVLVVVVIVAIYFSYSIVEYTTRKPCNHPDFLAIGKTDNLLTSSLEFTVMTDPIKLQPCKEGQTENCTKLSTRPEVFFYVADFKVHLRYLPTNADLNFKLIYSKAELTNILTEKIGEIPPQDFVRLKEPLKEKPKPDETIWQWPSPLYWDWTEDASGNKSKAKKVSYYTCVAGEKSEKKVDIVKDYFEAIILDELNRHLILRDEKVGDKTIRRGFVDEGLVSVSVEVSLTKESPIFG